MLAERRTPEPHEIRYPVLASPKIDGVRAIVKDGVVLSRSLKPIRNRYVQRTLAQEICDGLDGELVVGSPTDPNCMQNTTSGVMSVDGEPDYTFYVFDIANAAAGVPFEKRLGRARSQAEVAATCGLRVEFVHHSLIKTEAQLLDYETYIVDEGYEGIMLRDPNGPYKHGRSTMKEGYLLKVKRFEDGEAVVIGVEELMHNENEAKVNALGRSERSTAKGGLRGADTLGALIVRDCKTGVEFSIGTGFSQKQRDELWTNYQLQMGGNWPVERSVTGRIVAYKHFAQGGVKCKPRFPVFKGFRDPIDM